MAFSKTFVVFVVVFSSIAFIPIARASTDEVCVPEVNPDTYSLRQCVKLVNRTEERYGSVLTLISCDRADSTTDRIMTASGSIEGHFHCIEIDTDAGFKMTSAFTVGFQRLVVFGCTMDNQPFQGEVCESDYTLILIIFVAVLVVVALFICITCIWCCFCKKNKVQDPNTDVEASAACCLCGASCFAFLEECGKCVCCCLEVLNACT